MCWCVYELVSEHTSAIKNCSITHISYVCLPITQRTNVLNYTFEHVLFIYFVPTSTCAHMGGGGGGCGV
jgi:hypothetical protein